MGLTDGLMRGFTGDLYRFEELWGYYSQEMKQEPKVSNFTLKRKQK